MADYRQVHTSIWDDDWFIDLEEPEKVLFFWLFTNKNASVSGLYKFSVKVCARETNMSREQVAQIIAKFQEQGKVYFEGEYIWVVNLRKYNDSFSDNCHTRIINDLAEIPDGNLKDAYIAYYAKQEEVYQQRLLNRRGLPTPYQPLTNPLATPSGTENREQRTENTEQGTENREQRTENTEQGTENKEQGTENSDSALEVSPTQSALERIIGLPVTDVVSLNKIESMNPTFEDIQEAYAWKYANNNGKPFYLSGMIGPIQTAINKRLRKQPEKIPRTMQENGWNRVIAPKGFGQ